MEKRQWRLNFWHDVIGKFIWRCFISLVKHSYWSRFHVNIITVSGVMRIFFHKWLTRNPETENTPVWVLPNIYLLGMLGTSNLTQMSLIKCYWMLQNARITSFTVIKGKPTGGGVNSAPPPLPLRLALMVSWDWLYVNILDKMINLFKEAAIRRRLKTRCSRKIRKIYGKTLVSKSFFNN